MDKTPTRFYLDPELILWLKSEAMRQHCSMAQVVRSLIVEKMTAQRGGK